MTSVGPSTMAVLLDARGLSKSYRTVQALQDVDLQVHEGQVLGLLGANGAGKTTFTKCVTGFVRPDAGEVRLAGHDVLKEPEQANRWIGLVPDQYDFYGNMTGRQHLDFYARLFGIGPEERAGRVQGAVERVRAAEFADRRTKEYSHGMKQRICIAQAILHRPKLILFDEPTNGLDPRGAYELRELIKGLARDGHAIVLNSHLLHEVQETCDHVVILQRGRIIRSARVAELRAGAGRVAEIRVLNPSKRVLAAAHKIIEGPLDAHQDRLRFAADPERVADVVQAVVAAGGRVVGVHLDEANLEQAFLQITGEEGA